MLLTLTSDLSERGRREQATQLSSNAAQSGLILNFVALFAMTIRNSILYSTLFYSAW